MTDAIHISHSETVLDFSPILGDRVVYLGGREATLHGSNVLRYVAQAREGLVIQKEKPIRLDIVAMDIVRLYRIGSSQSNGSLNMDTLTRIRTRISTVLPGNLHDGLTSLFT